MKNYVLVLGLLLVLVSCNGSQSGEEVAGLSVRKNKWMVAGQLDSLASTLDPDLKYIHSNGLVQNSREVVEDIKSGKLSFQSIDVHDLQTRVFGNTAIVTGKGRFVGKLSNAPFSTDLMFTEVYVLKAGAWMLASRHANKI